MAVLYDACKERKNVLDIFRYIKYKIDFRRENPDYFDPDGLVVFCGAQGTGKTLSAVNYVCKLMDMYPKCKLVTNLFIKKYPIVTYEEYCCQYGNVCYEDYISNNRVFMFTDNDDLMKYENDDKGVIYLIDEIQLYLNSLHSKNVNMEVMTEISQQRKQRKHIVSTSQVFGRMAKPLREQFSNVIKCKNVLGFIQINKLIDRDSLDVEDNSTGTDLKAKVKKMFVWFHTPDMYGNYDTYYKIQKGNFVANEEREVDIYDVLGLSTDS